MYCGWHLRLTLRPYRALKNEVLYQCFSSLHDCTFNGIFLKHPWLIPNILKWQDCKIFTKLVPFQTFSRSSHWRCSVKGVLKNLRNFTGKHLCWSLFLIKFQVFKPLILLKRDSNTLFSCEICEIFRNSYFEEHLRTTASALRRIYKTLS